MNIIKAKLSKTTVRTNLKGLGPSINLALHRK